ncbi:MAG: polyprenyl synthetase family protein, partial [bacterium]
AYATLSDVDEPTIRSRSLDRISEAAGSEELLVGQHRDLQYENADPSADQVLRMYRRKTGALLGLAMELGAISAELPLEQSRTYRDLGTDLGVAFQIQDDLLEEDKQTETLGKSTGSDQTSNKRTYPRLVGTTEARRKAEVLINRSRQKLEELTLDTERIIRLADFIIERTY